MKVLLINPIIRFWHKPTHPPLGIGYIAAILLQNGINVEILDINARRYTDEQVREELKRRSYDIVGMGGVVSLFREVKKLTKMIKEIKPEAPIVIGGSVGDTIPEVVLTRTNADFCIIGEAEYTFLELCRRIEEGGKDFSDINGLAYMKGGSIYVTEKRKGVENLDEIPFPAYDLLEMDIYLKNQYGHTSGYKKSLTTSTTRGCVYACTFCAKSFRQYPYRIRSIDNVIAEIKYLKNKYDIDFIAFSDDLFVVSKKRVLDFCERMVNENLKIKWVCSSRVNLVDDEILRAMKKAGCVAIAYGVESGSQKILDIMDKKVKVEDAKNTLNLTFKNGLWPIITLICGMPEETKETIQETVEFMKGVGMPGTLFYLNPYPGTRLWPLVKNKILAKYDIEEYLEKLNDATDFVVNVTNMSDDELLKVKVDAEKQMRKNFLMNPFLAANRLIGYYNYSGGVRSIFSAIKRKLEVSVIPKLNVKPESIANNE